MKNFTINSAQEFIKTFNGAKCSLDEGKPVVVGVSGETKLYSLDRGGALFLRDDEVIAA